MSEKEPIYPQSNEQPPPYAPPYQPQQQQHQYQHQPPYPPQQQQYEQYQQQQQPYQQPQMYPPAPSAYHYGGAPASAAVSLRALPQTVLCQYCGQTVVTHLRYETGLLAWLLCGAIFLFGGVLGCCLIPFCVDGCKDVVHHCPNCSKMLGRFQRI